MSNIIKFPRDDQTDLVVVEPVAAPVKPTQVLNAKGKAFLAGLLRFVWVAVVLVWPVLKWVVSIEVFFQFIRMFYYWGTPGVYAGWTFLLHFAVLTALTYFVSIFKPKGL